MSLATWVAEGDAARAAARDRAAEARQIADDPARWDHVGPERCTHPKDALGSCTGICAGEEWDR